jgi:hypothetical protein
MNWNGLLNNMIGVLFVLILLAIFLRLVHLA